MLVTQDSKANAMYLAVGEGARVVDRTVELDAGTLVDFDKSDVVIGVEILDPLRVLPVREILDLHVPEQEREELRQYLLTLSGERALVTGTNISPTAVRVTVGRTPVTS